MDNIYFTAFFEFLQVNPEKYMASKKHILTLFQRILRGKRLLIGANDNTTRIVEDGVKRDRRRVNSVDEIASEGHEENSTAQQSVNDDRIVNEKRHNR